METAPSSSSSESCLYNHLSWTEDKDKESIREGQLVVIYAGRDSLTAVVLQRGAFLRNKYGDFPHDALIGRPWGTKLASCRGGGGYVYALRPSPELFTAGAIRHRTQIIFTVDISMITFYLQLKPGSVAIESGTGSGSLSRAIARTIAPHGHLYTFEFHQMRASAAREDFEREGMTHLITVTHGDVCRDGFKAPGLLERPADAVFLDLPAPHEAIPHITSVIRPRARICTFSPAIEQVQRTYQALLAAGFTELRTVECLLRPFRVHPETVEHYDLASLLPSSDANVEGKGTSCKRRREEAQSEEKEEEETKREKHQQEESKKHQTVKRQPGGGLPAHVQPSRAVVCEPLTEIRGHTSFLTFGTWPAGQACSTL